MLLVCIEYITGRVVASQPFDKTVLQWPPDPARFFMALTAAVYEGHGEVDEIDVLRWFENLPPPHIVAPEVAARSVETVFVPVNDKAADPWRRSKQPRTFPSAHVGGQPVRLLWPEVEVEPTKAVTLKRLFRRVVRVGHSSSLVRVWLGDAQDELMLEQFVKVTNGLDQPKILVPDSGGEVHLRVPNPGTLARLDRDYNFEAINQFASLEIEIQNAKQDRKPKLAKELSVKRDEAFAGGMPTFRRPQIRSTARYREVASDTGSPTEYQTDFDGVIVSLSQIEGPVFGLEQTLSLTAALRGAILKHFDQQAPRWVSGHETDGSPIQETHLALMPMAFVGESVRRPVLPIGGTPAKNDLRGSRVDGHLLGLGLVFPRHIPETDRVGFTEWLIDTDNNPRRIKLTHGSQPLAEFELEFRPSPPTALQPETWTAASTVWTTVTPIVLDRFIKTDRRKDRQGWRREVIDCIVASCEHIGLKRPPLAVDIGRHGFLPGVPDAHAIPKQRGGFPPMIGSDGKTNRPRIHALLQFDFPVRGPVLIGAGRYRGYGLCKPVRVDEVDSDGRISRGKFR